jgi:hydroxymethylglutaryl-CoA lyase
MLADMGIETGVDLARLLSAAGLARELVGHDLASRVSAAGPRWEPAAPRPEGT